MINYTVLLPILLIYILVTGAICFVKKNGLHVYLCNVAFGIYICFLLKVAFFPIPIQNEAVVGLRNASLEYNFIPLHSIFNILSENKAFPEIILLQILGNFVMLFPVGVYLPIIFRTCRSAKFMFLILLSIGIIVETTQHILNIMVGFHYRSVDIDDVILNILGGMLGYLLHKFVILIYNPVKQQEEQ